MEEVGIIKEIIGPNAMVVVQRKSACGSCTTSPTICKAAGDDEAAIEALNQANARAGDTVRVVFKPYTYLKGTVLIYGLPALMLIVGAIVGNEYISKIFINMNPDVVSAIVGFGFFAITFLIIKLLLKKIEGKKEYIPVIEEIVKE